MTDVVLGPMLTESVQAGASAVIDQWLVCEGDHVFAGQTLARANLVHSLVDVMAGHDGIVEEIRIPAGETFGPGTVLARLIAA